MSEVKAPEGMISVDNFSKRKGISAEKAIKMIKDGFYTGRIVNEEWFVSVDEVNNSVTSNTITTASSGVSVVNDYKTAIGISKFVSFVGWLIALLSVIMVFIAFAKGGGIVGLMAASSGFGLLLGGLFLVITGQMARATMDNANYSKLMLEEMRLK